jgi:hypothetical protein
VEGGLETGYAIFRNRSDTPTLRARDNVLPLLVSFHQPTKTFLAIDVGAVEYLWVNEGFETHGTVELFIQSFDSF